MESSTDVAIVGCGPVGAGLAIALRAQGFDVVVLEREPDIYHLPRAIGMDEEIFRALQNLGLGDEIAAMTTPVQGADFANAAGERILGFDFPEGMVGRLGCPPMVMYYQPDLDMLLRETAAARGADICLRAEVTGIQNREAGVTVELADGSAVEARWAVGCDGASSGVRKALGIESVDQGFDQAWIVIDIEWFGGIDELRGPARQICDPARPGTFVPGHGFHRRWEFQALEGETREELESDEKVWELVAPWMTPDQGRIIRAATYRFHAVVASRMREGNVFLAGDSAHQMPPFLGQGLNSGFRDAFNLAWKMGMVARAEAGDGLLDTYDHERRPHAARVVEAAVDAGRLIDALSGKGGEADESAGYGQRPFPELEGDTFPVPGAFVGAQSSQTRRPDGTFTDDRFESGFTVLVADDTLVVPDAWTAIGATVVAVEGAEIGGHGCSIVRPDRCVAGVADDQGALDQLTKALFGLLHISA